MGVPITPSIALMQPGVPPGLHTPGAGPPGVHTAEDRMIPVMQELVETVKSLLKNDSLHRNDAARVTMICASGQNGLTGIHVN